MATTPHGKKYRTEFVSKGQRFVKAFETRDAGQAWESYMRLQVALGKASEATAEVLKDSPKALTMGALFKLAQAHWSGTKNEQCACSNAKEVTSFFGEDMHAADLTNGHVDDLVAYLKTRTNPKGGGKLSPATINRKLAALTKLLKLAQRKGVPIGVVIEKQKEPEGRLRFLSPTEEVAVLALMLETEGKAVHDFVLFAIETGGRLSELLALAPAAVASRKGKRFLTFGDTTTKGAKTRSIPLTAPALRCLEGRMEGATIWPSEWHQWTIVNAWARVRTLQGITDPEYVFHCCRHTCATRLLEATGNLILVRNWMGHSSITTTERYTKVYDASLSGASDALDALRGTPLDPESPLPENGGNLGGNIKSSTVVPHLESTGETCVST
jgi:integrase